MQICGADDALLLSDERRWRCKCRDTIIVAPTEKRAIVVTMVLVVISRCRVRCVLIILIAVLCCDNDVMVIVWCVVLCCPHKSCRHGGCEIA